MPGYREITITTDIDIYAMFDFQEFLEWIAKIIPDDVDHVNCSTYLKAWELRKYERGIYRRKIKDLMDGEYPLLKITSPFTDIKIGGTDDE